MVKNNKVIAIDQNFNDAAIWKINSDLSKSMIGTAVEVTKSSNANNGGDFLHFIDLSAVFNRCPGCKYTCVFIYLSFLYLETNQIIFFHILIFSLKKYL